MAAGKVLALDWGKVRWGWALSDASRILAGRSGTHRCRGEAEDFAFLETLIAREHVTELVLGLPRNLDGSLGPQAREVLVLRDRLRARLGLPVHLVDERLTSAEAERVLREGGLSGPRRRARRDALAATLILQAFLERARR